MAKTILVVDDSAAIRELFVAALTEGGYRAVEAVDGLDALAKLEEHSVNLLISDLHMPNLDGIGLVRAVRAHPRYRFAPILVLTSDRSPAKEAEGLAVGATAWAAKPIPPQRLLTAIDTLLGEHAPA
ncbi:chemotaxis protein CheY [Stutzerimonas stutzeri]|uniref:Chemotaxis protein CheY n=1 Tax=Stutzerimonas stutzeri TaxID=316 RepID=W8RAC7_STUST|nr:response regulator [Stutzerimonas stutzeri]AHL75372.1 chemotaxis protein CheY [Stutzerimonas stutzeri]MCQ4328073.1 response regulator [Stutzerimonas stutzeri]